MFCVSGSLCTLSPKSFFSCKICAHSGPNLIVRPRFVPGKFVQFESDIPLFLFFLENFVHLECQSHVFLTLVAWSLRPESHILGFSGEGCAPGVPNPFSQEFCALGVPNLISCTGTP